MNIVKKNLNKTVCIWACKNVKMPVNMKLFKLEMKSNILNKVANPYAMKECHSATYATMIIC
jgi:hypothetical protein